MSSLSHQGHPTLSGLQWLACYFNPPTKNTHTHTHSKEIRLMQYVTFAKSRNVCVCVGYTPSAGALMFGNCLCLFTIGQLLFMSEPPPALSPVPSILSVMLTSTSARRHRTAAGEVEGGREGKRGRGMRRSGMKGAGVGESTGEGGDRGRDVGGGGEGERKRQSSKCDLSVSPGLPCRWNRVILHNESGIFFLTSI